MSERTIEDGVVVGISYIQSDADTGEVLHDGRKGEPYYFLHGKGSMLKGLEVGLLGLADKADFDITVEAADAFGERTGPGPQMVKRSEFRRDAVMREGMRFKAENSSGEEVALWVIKIAGSRVYVDTEHPLVGKRLQFVGTVSSIRDATDGEIEHGHAHGADGHVDH